MNTMIPMDRSIVQIVFALHQITRIQWHIDHLGIFAAFKFMKEEIHQPMPKVRIVFNSDVFDSRDTASCMAQS
jgi:hypothetical protein